MNYTITEIAQITGGQLTGPCDTVVQYILTDSRSLLYPAATVFFAIPGERHDGHNYIGELHRQGVRCFVVERLPMDDASPLSFGEGTGERLSFILVPDVLHALQQLAAQHRRRFLTPVIGITGSNGKTVVKEWIFQTIRHEKNIIRSPRSYNSQVGVSLSVCQLDDRHDLAIFEAGISQQGEMERLQTIIMPDIGVFTHLGEAHRENFPSTYEKAQEKLKLFRRCRTILYCRDCAEVADILENSPEYKAVSRFSWSEHGDADVLVTGKRREKGATLAVVQYGGQSFDLTIPFMDDASVENALHVVCLMLFMGYRHEIINGRIAQLEPVAMRLDIKKGGNRCTIINDSYNADTGSLAIALDLLARQQHPVKTIILSDILQSGKSQENLYREVAGLLTERSINRLVGIGPEISANENLFTCEKYFFATTDALLAGLEHNTVRFSDEAILVKGSRKFEFERIVQALEEKVHKTVLEINLNAVVHNYNYFKSLLQPQTKMVVMVKAFAYGSGSVEIANVLQFHRADYLAVAFADEGKELRGNGITLPIMVMNPEDGDFDTLMRNNLEPEIYNFRMLETCAQAASEQGICAYPVHIKLDTGMHRLGFLEEEVDRLANQLYRLPAVRVKSVFSHLAGSDEPELDDFVRQQVDAFRRMSGRIEERLQYPFLRHILNSAGIERFPEAQFDMVRLGIGLHGISVVDPSKVQQVATMRSIILQIKNIPAGDSVGYNRNFFAFRTMRIGIVPIGYADGLHRMLGNGTGSFLVNGQRAPLVGNMSMDMCAIDLTDIEAAEGDPAVIFGEEYPLAEIARQMQTIPYEVLTRVSPRVKRIYYQE